MKKAQVTIFIIIGLVVVIATAFFIYNYSNKKIMDFSEQEDSNIKELSPVKVYVEEAMQKLLVEGLFLISKQGGKVYDDTWPDCKEEDDTYTRDHRMCLQEGLHTYSYPNYLSQSPYNHKRVAVGINSSRVDDGKKWTQSSKEPMQQPFAYPHVGMYLVDHYLYGLNQPLAPINYDAGEHSIEAQLSRWIENHLLDIIDFREFKKMGFDITLPDVPPSVRVKINEDNIIVNMEYNISIEKSHKKYLLNEYYTQIDSNFRQLYIYVNTLINIDISSLKDIKTVLPMTAIINGQEEKIGGAIVQESIPNNHKYDIVNVTTNLIDYTKEYGYFDHRYLRFYFIRENRAPDASTVYTIPNYQYAGWPLTWYCFNYQTAGKWFDPDEDDEYTGEFPFSSPLWYRWTSRGDKLISEKQPYVPSIYGDDVMSCPNPTFLQDKKNPELTENGPDWVDQLQGCGNSDDDFTAMTSKEDVGDIIILTVGDSQKFSSDNIAAPLRYPDPKATIYADGTGRLNDVLTFQPVKCEPGTIGDDCGGVSCEGGYWGFNHRTLPETNVMHCVEMCKSCDGVVQTGTDTFGRPEYGCEYENGDAYLCNWEKEYSWHIDHKGNCVPYLDWTDYENHDEKCEEICDDHGVTCRDDKKPLCNAFPEPVYPEIEPGIEQDIKPVSCVNEDGYCQDQGIPVDENECGDYEEWVHLSDIDVIKKIEECKLGTCFIRGKEQVHKQNYFSCVALCKETGECDCPDDLDSCTGDWDWEVLPEEE